MQLFVVALFGSLVLMTSWILPTPRHAIATRPTPPEARAAALGPFYFEERYENITLSDGAPLLLPADIAAIRDTIDAAAKAMQQGRYADAEVLYVSLGLGQPKGDDKRAWRSARERLAVSLGEAEVVHGKVDVFFPSINGLAARRTKKAEPPAPRLTALNTMARHAELMADMVRVGVTPLQDPPTPEQTETYVYHVALLAKPQARAQQVTDAIARVMRGAFIHFRNAGGRDIEFDENTPGHYLIVVPGTGVVTSGNPPQPRIFHGQRELEVALQTFPNASILKLPSNAPGRPTNPWANITAPSRRMVVGMHEADCESFAHVAETLANSLEPMGFALLGHLAVVGPTPTGHASAVIRAPDNSVWLSSNDEMHRVEDTNSDGVVSQGEIMAGFAALVGKVYHLGRPLRHGDGFRIGVGVGKNPTDAARQANDINLLNSPAARKNYNLPETLLPNFSGS